MKLSPLPVLASASASALALLGLFAGFVPAAVEPGGQFVDCGAALFGRPTVPPDPSCVGAYAPFDSIAVAALALAAALVLVVAVTALVRWRVAAAR